MYTVTVRAAVSQHRCHLLKQIPGDRVTILMIYYAADPAHILSQDFDPDLISPEIFIILTERF